MTEAEARRRLGECYRILLDLAARRAQERRPPIRPPTRHRPTASYHYDDRPATI